MRIGIVCYPTVGGSGVVAVEVAYALAARGHAVHVLSYDRPSRLQREVPGLRFHQVEVTAYPLFRYPPYDLALATRMLEVHEAVGIDLFHVHYAIPHAVSAYLAKCMSSSKRLRFVTTLHGTDTTVVGSDAAYLRPTRFAIEQSDAVTAVSQFLAAATQRVFGVKAPIVVPNFVDPKRFRPGAQPSWYRDPNAERLLVHASNFRPVKRVADVVRAFALVAKEVNARLLLCGEGPDRDHALAVASDLGCAHRVVHRGHVDNLEQVLPEAHLFLSASETESFGLSMLEAMSCGVPCVSTDVGGVREVLGDSGLLTPLAQPEAMARAALTLLTDRERHQHLALRARQRAEQEFAIESVVDQYVALYERVAAS